MLKQLKLQNDYFSEAKHARYLPHFLVIILVSLVISIAAQPVGGAIATPLVESLLRVFGLSPGPRYEIFANLLAFFAAIVAIFIWVKFVERRSIRSLGFQRDKIGRALTGALFGIITLSIIVGIMTITGLATLEGGVNFSVAPVLCVLLLGFTLQASSEEIVARGWQFTAMGARYGLLPAVLFSSVFFTLLHLLNPGITVVAIVNLLLFSFIMCLYVLKTNCLWGACGFHAVWNFAQGNIFGFNISGIDGGFRLLNMQSEGSDVLSGGAYGPEAGLIATFVFLLIAGYLIKRVFFTAVKQVGIEVVDHISER